VGECDGAGSGEKKVLDFGGGETSGCVGHGVVEGGKEGRKRRGE